MFRAVSLALLLAACVSTGRPAGGDVLDDSYSVGGFRWTHGSIVYVFAASRNIGGELAICGAWSAECERATDSMLNSRVIAAAKFHVAGEAVLHGGAFMRKTPWQQGEILGKPTAWRATGIRWRPSHDGAEVRGDFPKMRFII